MKLRRFITIEYTWNVEKVDLSKYIGYDLDQLAEDTIFNARLKNITEGELKATVNGTPITGQWSFKYNFKKTGLKK